MKKKIRLCIVLCYVALIGVLIGSKLLPLLRPMFPREIQLEEDMFNDDEKLTPVSQPLIRYFFKDIEDVQCVRMEGNIDFLVCADRDKLYKLSEKKEEWIEDKIWQMFLVREDDADEKGKLFVKKRDGEEYCISMHYQNGRLNLTKGYGEDSKNGEK